MHKWLIKLIDTYTRNAFLLSELAQIKLHCTNLGLPIEKSFWQKLPIGHSFKMSACKLHLVNACRSVWFLKMWDTNNETHCTLIWNIWNYSTPLNEIAAKMCTHNIFRVPKVYKMRRVCYCKNYRTMQSVNCTKCCLKGMWCVRESTWKKPTYVPLKWTLKCLLPVARKQHAYVGTHINAYTVPSHQWSRVLCEHVHTFVSASLNVWHTFCYS